jgi:hypothetical protein
MRKAKLLSAADRNALCRSRDASAFYRWRGYRTAKPEFRWRFLSGDPVPIELGFGYLFHWRFW